MRLKRADPPKKAGGQKPVWPAVLAAVDAYRGDWVVVRECETPRKAGSLAHIVRTRHDAAGRYEIKARGAFVYARLKPA